MHIHFNYHGSDHYADISDQGDNKLVVLFSNDELEKQFGSCLPFYIQDKEVSFDLLNK